jgi:hypothetical protein
VFRDEVLSTAAGKPDAEPSGTPGWLARYGPELRVAGIIALWVVAFSFLSGLYAGEHAWRQHLGAEYFRVARALLDGRGFSDPFGEPTGPTAWVSPLYVLLLAALLSTLGSKTATAFAILGIAHLAYVFCGTTIYALVRRCRTVLPPWVAVVLYLAWISGHFYYFFLVSHDIWLHLTLCTFGTIALYRYVVLRQLEVAWWGAIGGFAGLSNPTIAITWAVLLAWCFLRRPAERRRCIAAGAIALACAAPWAVRNALVFQRFIPLKSNVGYELYQANVLDEDGVYTDRTFEQHPYVNLVVRAEVARAGEIAFIEKHRSLFREYLARHPWDYLRKSAHRLLAATLQFTPVNELDGRGAATRLRNLLQPLPTLFLIAGLCIRGPQRRLLGALAAFFLLYLSVYVAVAFYSRYLLPLTPLLMLLSLLGADQVLWALQKRGWSWERLLRLSQGRA